VFSSLISVCTVVVIKSGKWVLFSGTKLLQSDATDPVIISAHFSLNCNNSLGYLLYTSCTPSEDGILQMTETAPFLVFYIVLLLLLVMLLLVMLLLLMLLLLLLLLLLLFSQRQKPASAPSACHQHKWSFSRSRDAEPIIFACSSYADSVPVGVLYYNTAYTGCLQSKDLLICIEAWLLKGLTNCAGAATV